MGFYGNITDTSKTFFQFDKIFSSRKKMDQACAEKTDGIYTGRFVLIKYDIDEQINRKLTFYDFLLFGFRKDIDDIKIYIDHSCLKPYLYTTYSVVENPQENNWNLYYVKSSDELFYIKLKNQLEFDINAAAGTYYIANAYTENNKDRLVGLNTICYQRNSHTTMPSGAFYKCVGGNSEGEAIWEIISDYTYYGHYLANFQEDFQHYGNLFDYRGYDGTVWEKVYHGGIGQFIQVARLNGFVPGFEIYGDEPAQLPTTVYLDAQSTQDLYRVKVPSSWGFRIKQAEEDQPSEQKIRQLYYRYNNDGELEEYEQEIDADIYFNLNPEVSIQSEDNEEIIRVPLSHDEYDLKDEDTENQIIIKPSGESGKKYYSSRNGEFETQIDTYETSIHLPIIGNMISEGYDLIYGTGDIANITVNKNLRPRDIQWYNGNANPELKKDGNPDIGGKTYNLKTLAGNINTIHNILGQIVIKLNTFPTPADIENLSSEYIYEYNGEYYRKGLSYSLSELNENEYIYSLITDYDITSDLFQINKYYYKNNNKYYPAITYDASLAHQGYYLKNINQARYTPIDLELYQPGQYYWKDGENYYCDNNEDIPTFPTNVQYYKNIQTNEGFNFAGQYLSNIFYYKENNNYILSITSTPSAQIYYEISTDIQNNGNKVLYYKPNLFYYQRRNSTDQAEGKYFLAKDDHVFDKGANLYYKFIFDTNNPQYGVKEDEIIQYYSALKPPQNITDIIRAQPADINEYYIMINNGLTPKKFLPYENIVSLGIQNGEDPYTVPHIYYKLNITEHEINSLFLPGIYYELNNQNGNYTKAFTWTGGRTYFLITSVEEVTKKFYLPNTYYYYDNENNIYPIDIETTPSYNITTDYYIETPLYVAFDKSGTCPRGYEWSVLSAYIPPSISLATLSSEDALIKIDESKDSLFGLLLELNTFYSSNNEFLRDEKTIRGIYNSLKDILFIIKKQFKPNSILYINEFGQIESSNFKDYLKLKKIIEKYDEIMAL